MHILWNRSNMEQFWLYVGQAVKLHQRIANHKDQKYRNHHPSLHYSVWDTAEDMESVFVTLAVLKNNNVEEQKYLLNLEGLCVSNPKSHRFGQIPARKH